MKKVPQIGCACEKPTPDYTEYRSSELGIDHTNGRNAEVSIQQCKLCQRIWIFYCIKSEVASVTEQWFKGIVSKKDRLMITPENAFKFIESIDWYVFGGPTLECSSIVFKEKLNLES